MAQQASGNGPTLTATEVIKKYQMKVVGIGQRTVMITLSECRNKGTVSSPKKTKIRPKVTDKVDEFDRNAISQKVHQFWHNYEITTFSKILTAVNEDNCSLPSFPKTSSFRVLEHLNFEYVCKSRI